MIELTEDSLATAITATPGAETLAVASDLELRAKRIVCSYDTDENGGLFFGLVSLRVDPYMPPGRWVLT